MAITADVVVVELQARLNGYTSQLASAARQSTAAFGAIGASADAAEEHISFLRRSVGVMPTPLKAITPAATSATKAINKTGLATSNLAAQVNDIGVSLAAGQSPFLVMLQQGSQVAQVFNQVGGGVRGAAAAMKGALLQVINPVSLVTYGMIGLIGLATSFLFSAKDGANEAEAATDRLADTVSRLKDVYGEAADAQQRLSDSERLNLLFKAQFDLINATRTYRDELAGIPLLLQDVFAVRAGRDNPALSEGLSIIERFQQTVREGVPDVAALVDGFRQLSVSTQDAGIQSFTNFLIEQAGGAQTAEANVQQLADVIAILTNAEGAAADAARRRLGLMTEQNAAIQEQQRLLQRANSGGSGPGGNLTALDERAIRQSVARLRALLVTETESVTDEIGALLGRAFADADIQAAAAPFLATVSEFFLVFRRGEGDLIAFREGIAGMADLDPENAALQALVDELIAITDEMALLIPAVQEGEGAIKGFGIAGEEAKPGVDGFSGALEYLQGVAQVGLDDKQMVTSMYNIAVAAATSAGEIEKLTRAYEEALARIGAAAAVTGGAYTGGTKLDPDKRPPPPRSSGGQSDEEQLAEKIAEVIAELNAEREQLGATARQQAVYNALTRAGIDANHAMADEVTAAAEALYDAEEATRLAEEAVKALQDAIQTVAEAGLDAFESWVTGAKTAEEAVKDLIAQLILAEARALILSGIARLTGGPAQALGPIATIIGNMIGNNAQGTNNWRGGLTWVGERGPELLNLPRGSQVIPNHRAANSNSMVFSPVTHIDARGSSISREEIQILIDRRDRILRDAMPDILRRHRGNRRIG